MDGRVAPSPTAGPVPTPSPDDRFRSAWHAGLPILFANHPSRSAEAIGLYGHDEPWEFRENNDLAPDVYRGMEGAPGHQAAALTEDNSSRYRGSYWNPGAQTLGGFDQMTAIVGGLWGRPPRRGPPVLDRGFVRLAFPLRRTGESRERLLARRVPQDLGPRAPDLRRRPRRPSARPHVRGRRGPRDRARGQPDEREAPSRARRHATGVAGGAGHRDRPVPRPGDREPGSTPTPKSRGTPALLQRQPPAPRIPRRRTITTGRSVEALGVRPRAQSARLRTPRVGPFELDYRSLMWTSSGESGHGKEAVCV